MKFKLDENLGLLGADAMRAEGHDVMTVLDQQLGGASDTSLFEICCAEQRILITLDHDFGEVLRFPPDIGAGIVVLECRGRVSPALIAMLVQQLILHLRTRPVNRELWIVEPGRIRVREQPRSGSSNEDANR